ncbi:cupin domain-containing protein [Noviluteimonas gilva]|uniref:Cupin domain-containing protein n=1 Tax=Noviluteimonas gilva TaxID=2682097 RepID=A0A7C9HUD7_9GAMM|nr:cupin domain-containing protein [Lysobacter gilvus]MUV15273.1 cupin domain-containing protein [Lysobacter gilvus]
MKTNYAFGLAALSLVALLGGTMLAHAQQSGISRKDLLQENLSAPGRQVVQVSVGFAPGASAARHSHPGEEVAYVLEGRIEYHIDGKPPDVLMPGDTVFIPAGVVHSARNLDENTRSTELATYIVERGKPLVQAAAP